MNTYESGESVRKTGKRTVKTASRGGVSGLRKKPNRPSGISRSKSAVRILDEPATLVCLVFVAISMVFGGGPGQVGPAFIAIAGAGFFLLITAIGGGGARRFQALPLMVRLAVVLATCLPLIQLIPLPPAIWRALPGHGTRADVLESFGLANAWLPLSVTPVETAYSAVIALCMLGLFIATVAMSQERIRQLLILVVSVIGIGIAIGIGQYSGGGDTLQFHRISHGGALIGFFANKNHMALTLACFIPLTFALIEHRLDHRPSTLVFLGFFWITVMALIVATNSRAGLLLGSLGIFLASLRLYPHHRKRVTLGAMILAALVISFATAVPTVRNVIYRFGTAREDLRLDFLDQAEPLIREYGLLGSGLGSFVSVYAPIEKLEWVSPYYVNHLHNDWLQLVIEAGIPGIAILALLILACGRAARMMWSEATRAKASRSVTGADDQRFAWAGLVMIAMFALHSLGDYPARRVGTLTLLVIAFALVFRPYLSRVRPAVSRPVTSPPA